MFKRVFIRHVKRFSAPSLIIIISMVLLQGCKKDKDDDSCTALFGQPVAATGLRVSQCNPHLVAPFDSLVECISALGFSKPCAQIWAYNLRNTQTLCFQYCIKDTFYNKIDGLLNDCLACDEQYSGPVFKAVAGCTRRNTGIASAICRFCEEMEPVEHNYLF